MPNFVFAVFVFLLLSSVALLALRLQHRLPESHRSKESQDAIKVGVGLVVVLSALVLGLLISSVRTSFDFAARDLKRLSTQIILLDRTLRAYGPDALPARQGLADYVERALAATWPADGGDGVIEDPQAEDVLETVRNEILAYAPDDERHRTLAAEARTAISKLLEQRWTLIEDSSRSLNLPFLVVLIFWLSLVFASFGYNAPRNGLVRVSLVLCALSISVALFLIVEMDAPLEGVIKVSGEPLENALLHLRQ